MSNATSNASTDYVVVEDVTPLYMKVKTTTVSAVQSAWAKAKAILASIKAKFLKALQAVKTATAEASAQLAQMLKEHPYATILVVSVGASALFVLAPGLMEIFINMVAIAFLFYLIGLTVKFYSLLYKTLKSESEQDTQFYAQAA